MARKNGDVLIQMLGSKDLEIARLTADNEALTEDNAALRAKLPIEKAALHEAKKNA